MAKGSMGARGPEDPGILPMGPGHASSSWDPWGPFVGPSSVPWDPIKLIGLRRIGPCDAQAIKTQYVYIYNYNFFPLPPQYPNIPPPPYAPPHPPQPFAMLLAFPHGFFFC